MKRYDMYQDYDMLVKPEEHVRGEWVYYDDAQATIARLTKELENKAADILRLLSEQLRLTAELTQSRAETAAAYERAAHLIECDGDAMGGKIGAAKAIRALATEADSTALAESEAKDQVAYGLGYQVAILGFTLHPDATSATKAHDKKIKDIETKFIADYLQYLSDDFAGSGEVADISDYLSQLSEQLMERIAGPKEPKCTHCFGRSANNRCTSCGEQL